MELAVFAIFGFLALASAIVVVAHRNPVYSTMSLVVTLVSTAVLFVLLGSPFLAAYCAGSGRWRDFTRATTTPPAES